MVLVPNYETRVVIFEMCLTSLASIWTMSLITLFFFDGTAYLNNSENAKNTSQKFVPPSVPPQLSNII